MPTSINDVALPTQVPGTDIGVQLDAAPATVIHNTGFVLPDWETVVGATDSGIVTLGAETVGPMRLQLYSTDGIMTWQSADFAGQILDFHQPERLTPHELGITGFIVTDSRILVFARLKSEAAGLTPESVEQILLTYNTTVPTDVGEEAVLNTEPLGDTPLGFPGVKFDEAIYFYSPDSYVSGQPRAAFDIGSGGLTALPEQALAVAANGEFVTNPSYNSYSAEHTFQAPAWPRPIVVTENDIDQDLETGIIHLRDQTPDGDEDLWLQRDGTVILTRPEVDGGRETEISTSPNGAWIAASDSILDRTTGQSYSFPAGDDAVAAQFHHVDNRGVGWSLSTDNDTWALIEPVSGEVEEWPADGYAPCGSESGWATYCGDGDRPVIVIPPES